MQLYSLQTLQKKCNLANLTSKLYSKSKTSICLANGKTVILFILYITNNYKYAHSKLNAQFITSEKDINMYLAFPDGSCNNNTEDLKAGYGVYFGPNNPLNTYARTRNAQTVNNSELEGVEHILIVFPINKNLFEHQCPKLISKQIIISQKVGEMIKEAILVSGKGNWFNTKGILYTPLKYRIPTWKKVRNKEEIQLITEISQNQRNKIKSPLFRDWFSYINKPGNNHPMFKVFDIFVHSGMIGMLPPKIMKTFTDWGITKKVAKRLIINIQCCIGDYALEVWYLRCMKTFAEFNKKPIIDLCDNNDITVE